MAEVSSENIMLAAFFLGFLICYMMIVCKSKLQSADDNSETIPVVESIPDSGQIDDLKIVEGIGPKIESLLHAAGITSMRNLALAETATIKEILDAAGPSFRMHQPKTWSTQAKFIADELWDELKEYQDILKGGRDS